MEKYDYIVVGAGSAGSIVASKLAAHDSSISILLIEAGETPNKLQMWTPSDWFEVLQNCSEIEWGYQSVPQPRLNSRVIQLAQAKVLDRILCRCWNTERFLRSKAFFLVVAKHNAPEKYRNCYLVFKQT
ncbi:lycopene cyclase family protein [Nostoc sp.]|uniref:lycopene cyclase family protein n=1 Tax=Nostoc sp. TaxID=1180 RepID=UPI002FFA5887